MELPNTLPQKPGLEDWSEKVLLAALEGVESVLILGCTLVPVMLLILDSLILDSLAAALFTEALPLEYPERAYLLEFSPAAGMVSTLLEESLEEELI